MSDPLLNVPITPAQPGLLLIISGPSGAGKTTIAHEVERALGAMPSVSLTTRPKLAKDTPGKRYEFVDRAGFERRRDAGELLEWAEVFGNLYGTPRGPVEQALALGKLVLLEIDVRGAAQVKAAMPAAMGVFILPPSEEALLHRLRSRGRDDDATIARRYAEARREIAEARASGVYDRYVVNDGLARTIEEVVGLVLAELSRRRG
jgi:guanylate kinase